MTHQDDVYQTIAQARLLYDRANSLLSEAITKAATREETRELSDRLREAKHAMASPLTVIYNIGATKNASKSKPDSLSQPKTLMESKPR